MMQTELSAHVKNIKKNILRVSFECGKNVHLGGAFSMVELLSVLYLQVLRYRPDQPEWEDRDRFILSKGHCAIALYAVLAECGVIGIKELDTFMQNDSALVVHPVMSLPLGLESSNGSLGQGLSLAVGLAQAAKLKGKTHHIYTLVGNGECNEGAVWEAAMLAASLKLDNLTVLVDDNRFQSDGESSRVLDMGDAAAKWTSFGFDVRETDGHDCAAIYQAFQGGMSGKPRVILGRTVKGHGISFMENRGEWHHNRLTKQLYEQALAEVEGT